MSKKLKFILFIIWFVLFAACIVLEICFQGIWSFVSTIISGLLVGLLSSFIISYYFESEKNKNKKIIKNITMDNFVYNCVAFLRELENWGSDYFEKESNIFSNLELYLNKMAELKNIYKKEKSKDIDSKYKDLIDCFNYYVVPIYYEFIKLNNLQLLVGEILKKEEYDFFEDSVRNNMFSKEIKYRKSNINLEEVVGEIIFGQLRICFNCVIDAEKIFPKIRKLYEK